MLPCAREDKRICCEPGSKIDPVLYSGGWADPAVQVDRVPDVEEKTYGAYNDHRKAQELESYGREKYDEQDAGQGAEKIGRASCRERV